MSIFRGIKRRKRVLRREQKRVEKVHVRSRRKIRFTETKSFRISLGFFILAAIGFLIYFFFFSSNFQITEVVVEHDRVTIQTSFNPDFFTSLVGKNIFLISDSDVWDIMAQTNSPIKEIHLKRRFPSTLIIELLGHPVVARTKWLNGDYYITQDGYLVSSSENESLVLPFITLHSVVSTVSEDISEDDQEEEPAFSFGSVYSETFRERVVDPDDLEKILELLDRFNDAFDVEVLEASYFHVAHEVSLRTLSGTNILFDLTKSLDNQFYKLQAIARKARLDEGALSQIDLRIGENKIYYVE